MWHLRNIHLSFGQRIILQKLDADIFPGDFIALRGSNGSGKSTLLNILAGSLEADSGSLWQDSREFSHFNEAQRASDIGRLTQDPVASCAIELTVEANLALAALKGRPSSFKKVCFKITPEAQHMANCLGLDIKKLSKIPVGQLSGGQRQALVLIMVLLSKPKLLLLDEPTAALDESTSHRLLTFIQEWVSQEKTAAIMITHDTAEANLVCNKFWYLEEGKIQLK